MFKIYFLVIILFSFKIYSQNIKGVIKNDLNEPINANILIKNSENKKIISDPKWVSGEIIKHYQKWKDFVSCNFKVEGLS